MEEIEFRPRESKSFLVKMVMSLSGGKINTTEGANGVMLVVAIIFFVLSALILVLGR